MSTTNRNERSGVKRVEIFESCSEILNSTVSIRVHCCGTETEALNKRFSHLQATVITRQKNAMTILLCLFLSIPTFNNTQVILYSPVPASDSDDWHYDDYEVSCAYLHLVCGHCPLRCSAEFLAFWVVWAVLQFQTSFPLA